MAAHCRDCWEDIKMSGVTHLGELISGWVAENGFGLNCPQTLGYTTLLNGRYGAPGAARRDMAI
ncbi:hypothetical protein FLM9_1471 [Candidatus Synechococcus spongiarum]|uniref:Uncharacterized protein n=1 Tax=Candidatus Synechococcus spongiarum TaxID=431041 RepID=A0A164Y6A4_9SYNE|nr:hypothetical protein FLM9_1471 [Candidatus Synechococcus spongiarum]